MRIYLDNAATTPLDAEVMKVMYSVMESNYGNPSSIHAHGREARTLVERSRQTIAKLLHTSPAEIFLQAAVPRPIIPQYACGIVDNNITHAITTRIEHHAVIHTLEPCKKAGAVKLSFVDVGSKGNVDYIHLEKLLKDNERSFVSLMHANNEIGTLTDIERVGDICEQYNAIFHCDTVQTIGHYPHDPGKLKVSFLVGAAHKFHGPKGVGFLYINHKIKIRPLIYGGSQERNMRAVPRTYTVLQV